jgi:DNA-directed RNA polymerase subunit RPC12/RpoP
MLIYSDSFYAKSNGNGYDLDERDAICSNCNNILDRQIKYRTIDTKFRFSTNEKDKWRNCPYCGEKLEVEK